MRIHKAPRAHLVGIAGSGMRSLADVLAASGWQVSGSDLRPDDFIRQRFNANQGHTAEAIDDSIDLVVYSDAVSRSNPELRRARERKISTASYAEMLARLMVDRNGVAIAGTHGKSTTTAMAAEILAAEGLDPTFVIGAVPRGAQSGGRLGRSRWMLAEACEYRANFLHLSPKMAAVLSVDPDHFDCFATQAELERAFAEFVGRVPDDGLVLRSAECEAARRCVTGLACAVESFGFTPGATWHAAALRERRGYYSFQVRCKDRLVSDVVLNVPGRHNVANAVAAAALASHCGATGRAIRQGLARFAGLRRRMELVSDGLELAIVDDYAHHPIEVSAALSTVRQMYPGRRVWCVFEPHQASRTARLLHEFAHSLQNADRIIVAEIVRAREPASRRGEITASDLAREAAALGAEVVHLPSAVEIRRHLQQNLEPADVLVTLGAGDIGNVAHGMGQRSRTFRQAG